MKLVEEEDTNSRVYDSRVWRTSMTPQVWRHSFLHQHIPLHREDGFEVLSLPTKEETRGFHETHRPAKERRGKGSGIQGHPHPFGVWACTLRLAVPDKLNEGEVG